MVMRSLYCKRLAEILNYIDLRLGLACEDDPDMESCEKTARKYASSHEFLHQNIQQKDRGTYCNWSWNALSKTKPMCWPVVYDVCLAYFFTEREKFIYKTYAYGCVVNANNQPHCISSRIWSLAICSALIHTKPQFLKLFHLREEKLCPLLIYLKDLKHSIR
jgi:hypothetical protein